MAAEWVEGCCGWGAACALLRMRSIAKERLAGHPGYVIRDMNLNPCAHTGWLLPLTVSNLHVLA